MWLSRGHAPVGDQVGQTIVTGAALRQTTIGDRREAWERTALALAPRGVLDSAPGAADLPGDAVNDQTRPGGGVKPPNSRAASSANRIVVRSPYRGPDGLHPDRQPVCGRPDRQRGGGRVGQGGEPGEYQPVRIGHGSTIDFELPVAELAVVVRERESALALGPDLRSAIGEAADLARSGRPAPHRQPRDGNVLAVDHLPHNALQRGLRALGGTQLRPAHPPLAVWGARTRSWAADQQ